jgi:outer membrane immunogenic protein
MTFRKTTDVAIAFATSVLATALLTSPLAAQQANPSWNGFYAGLNAGGIWGSTSSPIGMNNTGGEIDGVGAGFVGGVQAGYNYLMGPVLLGAEIDFQGSTLTSNVNGSAGPSTINAVERMPWFSTMRVRAGYPVGSVMPYVTGGAVWGERSIQGNVSDMGSFYADTNFWTWTVGGGIEGQVADHWTLKLEYLYIGTPSVPLSAPATTSIDEQSIGNVVRIGANYRF